MTDPPTFPTFPFAEATTLQTTEPIHVWAAIDVSPVSKVVMVCACGAARIVDAGKTGSR